MPRNNDQFGAYKCIGGEQIFMGNINVGYKAIGIDNLYLDAWWLCKDINLRKAFSKVK